MDLSTSPLIIIHKLRLDTYYLVQCEFRLIRELINIESKGARKGRKLGFHKKNSEPDTVGQLKHLIKDKSDVDLHQIHPGVSSLGWFYR
jgi:hypothetical protein